jgi:CysZ protein
MLPALVVLIAGMFQERTIDRVERAYYPDEVRKEEPRFWPDVKHDIRFTLWALFLNILVLPLYFIGIGFIVSIALNSYLLGREFFEGAAGYHVGKPEAEKLGQQNKAAVYGGGLVITLMTLLPGVNLFVPIFAIVWMVHVYHGLR